MAACGKRLTEVTRFVRKLRGGSQPMLVEATDGLLYVAKFADNLQGPNLAFNESMGYELYRSCGLRVPAWKPLLLTQSFIARHPECWFETEHGLVKPTPGLCFGSLFLGTEGTRLFEILPETGYQRIRNRARFWMAWLVDICAYHADNRQVAFTQDAENKFDAHFVDMGHLFGGPKGNIQPLYICSRYLDSRIYPTITFRQVRNFQKVLESVDADRLWQQAGTLPEEWKAESALRGFGRCLQRLSDPILLQNLLNAIVELNGQTIGMDRCNSRIGRTAASVLRFGVQAGNAEPRAVPYRTGRIACG
jgi:hypothetical protein